MSDKLKFPDMLLLISDAFLLVFT